jgi:hypothetical protein
MSIGVAFGAGDGVLVLVDGLKSVRSRKGESTDIVRVDQQKYAIVPGTAGVVVLTGAASLAGSDAWTWAERAVAPDAHDGIQSGSARDIARAVVRDLEGAMELDNRNRRDQGYEVSAGIAGFVAHIDGAWSFRHRPLGEVWAFDLDHNSVTGPSEVLAFSDPDPALAWPFVAVPARASHQDPDADGQGRLPADVIADQFNSAIPTFRSRTLVDIKAHVEDQMAAAIDSAPDVFARHGVGGIWTILELRPHSAVNLSQQRWGPN